MDLRKVTIKPSNITKDDEAAAMAAMFQAQTANWEETQEKMSQLVSRSAIFVPCSTSRPNEHFHFSSRIVLITELLVSTRIPEVEAQEVAEANRSNITTSIVHFHRVMCAIVADRKVGTCQGYHPMEILILLKRSLDPRLPDE